MTASGESYRLHEPLPRLNEPVMVAMLTGWIDASGAAAAALAAVEADCGVRPLVTFDGDAFLDYRARRPTMELREGVNERLVWPEIELKVGADASGRDVVVLTGPEPDSAWRRFAEVVSDLAVELGVRRAVFLGAYPFAAPHTRPPRLSSSSPSAEIIATVPYLKNSVDVPAGMGAVLEHALVDKGVPALGIWAQVPHYLGTMTFPTASVALIDGLQEVGGLIIDTTSLRTEATIQRERINQLVSGNSEHQAMIEQLESLYDQVEALGEAGELGASPMSDDPIPSVDELAAEFEQFLRDQTD
jgi:PAC2 family